MLARSVIGGSMKRGSMKAGSGKAGSVNPGRLIKRKVNERFTKGNSCYQS